MTLSVASFYRFVPLPDAAALQGPLHALCAGLDLKGTVLLAPEGLNGTLAGPPGNIAALATALREGPLFGDRLAGLEIRLSRAAEPPFGRLKVRLKPEIITLGEPADPASRTGRFVPAAAWNELLDDPAIPVIDTRNGFEVAMGTFEGAIDPGLRAFRDFSGFARTLDPARHPTVALFCTGGIRCEKASALLLARGFTAVHQLNGGILRYLETVPPAQSRWRGACFVFDSRTALGHGLAPAAPAEVVHG